MGCRLRYRGACALGPGILLAEDLPRETGIHLKISRAGESIFEGSTGIDQLKRSFTELAAWLFKENEFPYGCLLLTGTGLVPPGKFTLHHGDSLIISIDGVGTLENHVGL